MSQSFDGVYLEKCSKPCGTKYEIVDGKHQQIACAGAIYRLTGIFVPESTRCILVYQVNPDGPPLDLPAPMDEPLFRSPCVVGCAQKTENGLTFAGMGPTIWASLITQYRSKARPVPALAYVGTRPDIEETEPSYASSIETSEAESAEEDIEEASSNEDCPEEVIVDLPEEEN